MSLQIVHLMIWTSKLELFLTEKKGKDKYNNVLTPSSLFFQTPNLQLLVRFIKHKLYNVNYLHKEDNKFPSESLLIAMSDISYIDGLILLY